jgi:hypothetical protein
MIEGRHSAFRRAAWLALLALFLQIAVPLFHRPASADVRAGISGANLCMAPGSVPAAPTDGDKAPAHKAPACAICQTLHMLGGGFVPPNDPGLLAAQPYGAVLSEISSDSFPQRRIVSDARARAPPTLA